MKRNEVKKRILEVAIVLCLALAGCSPQLQVSIDFDRTVEIHRLTTYSWLSGSARESRSNPLFLNELTGKRVRNAVDTHMESRGYVRVPEGGEIVVHYHIVEDRVAMRPENYGYKYSPNWTDNMEAYRYKEGTLMVDFMDSKDCELMWRGLAVSVLDDEKAISEDLINRAIGKIFESFPTSAAKEVLDDTYRP